jgi:hypothetical protein
MAPYAAFGARAIACTAVTAHFRLWWDERRGSHDAAPGVDGRCRTLPPIVEQVLATVERLRTAELALGFRDAPGDRGLPRNGGDGRHDIYIHHTRLRGQTGSSLCSYLSRGTKIVRSSASTIVSPGAGTGADLEETVAHELFHGIQCRYVPRLSRLPAWVAEGTANWVAALVTPGVFAARPSHIGNLMARLARSAAGDVPLTAQAYDAWGFWYSVTGGSAHPAIVRDVLARVGRGASALTAIRAAIPHLADAVRTYAADVARGTTLGGTALPLAFPNWLEDPQPLEIGPGSPTDRLSLAPLEYSYRAVSWSGGGGGSLTLVGAASLSGACELVSGDGSPIAAAVSGSDLVFALPPGDGSALLVASRITGGATIHIPVVTTAPTS